MAANRLKMDAVTLVAAAQTNDTELTETVIQRHETNPADLARECANVAALLAGTGAARNAITGYLDFIGAAASANGKR